MRQHAVNPLEVFVLKILIGQVDGSKADELLHPTGYHEVERVLPPGFHERLRYDYAPLLARLEVDKLRRFHLLRLFAGIDFATSDGLDGLHAGLCACCATHGCTPCEK